MPFLREFYQGDRVFIAVAEDDWLGVEVRTLSDESGQMKVEIAYHNGIPGYELGDIISVSEGVLACQALTVDAAIEGKAGAAGYSEYHRGVGERPEVIDGDERGVVTLTTVLLLPGPMPTEDEYRDGGGVQFVELIEKGRGELLFAAAEPGVTSHARRLGAEEWSEVDAWSS